MRKSRGLSRPKLSQDVWEAIRVALLWRPRTVLEYLLVVAVLGIVMAALVILGVQLHLVHRLL